MFGTIKAINAGLAFFLELAMLAGFGYWGFYGDKSVLIKWLLGIGIPVIVAVVWGMFFAPNSGHRQQGLRLCFEFVHLELRKR